MHEHFNPAHRFRPRSRWTSRKTPRPPFPVLNTSSKSLLLVYWNSANPRRYAATLTTSVSRPQKILYGQKNVHYFLNNIRHLTHKFLYFYYPFKLLKIEHSKNNLGFLLGLCQFSLSCYKLRPWIFGWAFKEDIPRSIWEGRWRTRQQEPFKDNLISILLAVLPYEWSGNLQCDSFGKALRISRHFSYFLKAGYAECRNV